MIHHVNPNVESLMKRGYLYLEDNEWSKAKEYFDDSLDVDPENAQAYIGMLLADMHKERECDLYTSEQSFEENYYYKKAVRFANEEYLKKIQQYNLDNIYYRADKIFKTAKSEDDYKAAAELFGKLFNNKDALEQKAVCLEWAEKTRIEKLYNSSKVLINSTHIDDVKKAKDILKSIKAYKDSTELIEKCEETVASLEKQKEIELKNKKKLIAIFSVIALIIIVPIFASIISVNNKRVDVIYNNFLGKTFDGKIEDDDGFVSAYRSNRLNKYQTYWLNTEVRTLTFKNDGSVYYTYNYDMNVLAYPSSMSEPEGFHNEYDGMYNSFKVRVSLAGDVYVKLGSTSYEVTVNDNDVPTKINNYYGMTLR